MERLICLFVGGKREAVQWNYDFPVDKSDDHCRHKKASFLNQQQWFSELVNSLAALTNTSTDNSLILYVRKSLSLKIESCSSSFHSFLFPFFAIQRLRSTTVNVTDSVRFPRHCERTSAASAKGHDWSLYFLSSHKAAHKQQLLFRPGH